MFPPWKHNSPSLRLFVRELASEDPKFAREFERAEKKFKKLKAAALARLRAKYPEPEPEPQAEPQPETAPEIKIEAAPAPPAPTPAPAPAPKPSTTVLPFPAESPAAAEALARFCPPAGSAARLVQSCRKSVADATDAEVAFWISDRAPLAEGKASPLKYTLKCVEQLFQSPDYLRSEGGRKRYQRERQSAAAAAEQLHARTASAEQLPEPEELQAEAAEQERQIDAALAALPPAARAELRAEAVAALKNQKRYSRLSPESREREIEHTARLLLAQRTQR